MDIEILKDVARLQQELTRKARRGVLAALSTAAPDLERAAIGQREHMVQTLEGRLRALTEQRDRAIARYDEEIKDVRLRLEQMRAALEEERRRAAAPSAGDTPPGPARKSEPRGRRKAADD